MRGSEARPSAAAADLTNGDLRALADRFLGEAHAARSFADFAEQENLDISPSLTADRRLLQFTERLLAGAIGAASARVVITTALRKTGMEIGDVVLLLDETLERRALQQAAHGSDPREHHPGRQRCRRGPAAYWLETVVTSSSWITRTAWSTLANRSRI